MEPTGSPSSATTAPVGTTNGAASLVAHPATALDNVAEGMLDFVWRELKRRPYVGVAAIGAGGCALASLVGVAEIAFGVATGYAAYQLLLNQEPPSKAIRDAAEVGRELMV
jgi:hypothetical protein